MGNGKPRTAIHMDEHKDIFEEWLKTKKPIGISVVNINLSDFPDFEELKGSHK